ncbi:LAME_0E07954g1_1 [Lachancea meyersii CBS 8951]|uniref:LAME_0E07954g1_1 n=1 Tax=Lachancea meyersii CBS 8951 TaxID=1266667 RepID=A0A1G4JIM1_9SACH|nr:LAME_0E07954g1_1 [Lachancea meyersii CBS 8951]
MSSLEQLRLQLMQKQPITFLSSENGETDDILEANRVLLGTKDQTNNTVLELDEKTDFQVDGNNVPLKVVLHCWQHRDSSAADYLADCQTKKLINISFLQRMDLIAWLSGETESSQFVNAEETKVAETVAENLAGAPSAATAASDPVLQEALAHEKELLDHNSSLRGSKPTNFAYLIKEAELKLVHSLKSASKARRAGDRGTGGVSKTDASSGGRGPAKKDPIILIPSAASSIFTIANIQQFLEDSKYVHPRDLPGSQSDVTSVTKKLDRFARPVKFLIASNTRLFTKPEYWDRVVAVFTTGHAWQFNNYQWSDPSELFQRCKGYYFYFAGDIVPKHVEQWNVQRVELDKNKRFRDVEVLRYFWNTIERELASRGYQ